MENENFEDLHIGDLCPGCLSPADRWDLELYGGVCETCAEEDLTEDLENEA